MIRYAFHRLLGHETGISEMSVRRYHCYSCSKRWGQNRY